MEERPTLYVEGGAGKWEWLCLSVMNVLIYCNSLLLSLTLYIWLNDALRTVTTARKQLIVLTAGTLMVTYHFHIEILYAHTLPFYIFIDYASVYFHHKIYFEIIVLVWLVSTGRSMFQLLIILWKCFLLFPPMFLFYLFLVSFVLPLLFCDCNKRAYS